MTRVMTRAEFNALKRGKPQNVKTMTREQFNTRVASKAMARPKTMTRTEFRALSANKPRGFSGFVNNAKTDFGSFAKGLLGIGREFITSPKYNIKKLGGIGKEFVKEVPSAVSSIYSNMKNYPETQRKGIEAFKQLQKIPLAQQKEMLSRDIKRIGESKKGNADQRKLAQLGLGALGGYSQYSRFKEKAYAEPFSFLLDILPATKSLGAGKLLAKGGKIANKIPMIARTSEKLTDAFVPMGRLKRLGYGDVAEDLSKTTSNIRRSQEGIIKSTLKKFEKDFKLSKAEKSDFFETIDKGRRVKSYIPKSSNPKVQKAIDWYMKEELPRIRKIAGYKKGEAPIENYLHHFFNPTKETRFGGKLSSPQRGFLKHSEDVEGFSKDPVVSIAGVKSKGVTANIKQGFLDRLAKKYAKKDIQEFKNGRILGKDGEELAKYKGKYLPKDLTEELTRIDTGEPGWLKTILEPARTFNRNWKPLATAVRPRYHLRNIIGNVYNASFIGGAKPQRYLQALGQQMKNHIATQMKEGTIAGKVYKSFFKEPPSRKYLKMAIDDDVVGKGFFTVDINDMADIAETTQDFSKAIARLENPAMVYKIPGLKQWMNGMQSMGSAIEDNARLALYIDRLKKGANRLSAKKYVDKHLFDYMTGLGDADKVIKAVIPFWSWRRFNVPLQFGALAKNPLRHLVVQQGGKPFVQQNEANNPEYKFLSQRLKDMGAVKIGEVEKNGHILDKYMRTQSVLPIQDVGSLTDPDNMGISPVFDMIKQGYRSINPPENPQENLNYYGRPVEQFPGEVKNYFGGTTRGTTKEILQDIPLISEINKAIGGSYTKEKRPDLKTRLESVINPLSSTLQDRAKNREYFEKDFDRKYGGGTFQPGYLSELKYYAKKAIANPEDKASTKNFITLVNLMKNSGMSEEQIKEEISKAIQSELKKEKPKPKKASSLRPKRPRPLLDPYYQREILNRMSKLKPYY